MKLRRLKVFFFLITPPQGGKPQTTISCMMWCWMNVSHCDNKVWALGSLPPTAASWPGGDFLPAASSTQGYYCGGGSERRCSTCLKLFPLGPPRCYRWAQRSQPVLFTLLKPRMSLFFCVSACISVLTDNATNYLTRPRLQFFTFCFTDVVSTTFFHSSFLISGSKSMVESYFLIMKSWHKCITQE